MGAADEAHEVVTARYACAALGVAGALALVSGCGAAPRTDAVAPPVAPPTVSARAGWVAEDDPLAVAPDAATERVAARELVPQWGHTAGTRELRWLPTGPLAVLDDLGHLALLEPSSGARLVWERPAPVGPWEEPFELDRSGRYLRVGGHLHDLVTGDESVLTAPIPEGAIAALAPDLSAAAWAGRGPDGRTRLSIARIDGTVEREVELELGRATAIAWSPTARAILVADSDALELRGAADGARLARFVAADGARDHGVVGAFRPSGGTLAVLAGGDLVLVSPRDGRELGRVRALAPPRTWAELRWSADGGRLAVARRDDEATAVVVFDAHDGSRVGEVRVPYGLPSEVMLSPDARLLAVGTSDGRVHVHEADGGAEVVLVDSGRATSSPPFAFDPRGRFLALATGEAIDVWDLELREEIGGFFQPGAERHLSAMHGLEGALGVLVADDAASYLWTPDAFHMDEACAGGGAVRIDAAGAARVVGATAVCDLTHGITVRPGWWIRGSSPDGRVVVNTNGGLFVEDAVTGERRTALVLDEGERPPCTTSLCGLPVAVSEGGARVAVARRTLLRVFDGRTGAVRARAEVGGRTRSLRFSPGGRALSYLGEDGELVIFDAASLARRLARETTGTVVEGFTDEGDAHVHATSTSLTVLRLGGRRAAPVEVALDGTREPLELALVGRNVVLVRAPDDGARASDDGRVRVEVRALADGALVRAVDADAASVAAGAGALAICASGVLGVVTLDGAPAGGAAPLARPIGTCAHAAMLDTTRDGRFVYLKDDEGLHVVRAADGARLTLHLVDAGWGVTATIVRDGEGRWDDGGYFDAPFLLRSEGPIARAVLGDAHTSFVAGLAGHFVRGESPPVDDAAQPEAATSAVPAP